MTPSGAMVAIAARCESTNSFSYSKIPTEVLLLLDSRVRGDLRSAIAAQREITPMISSIEPEEHALQASWAFTYFKKNQNKSYEDNTTTLGTVRSAEDFWRLYVHLRRPATGTGSDERTVVCDYHVFREGIKPMWEDEENRQGGASCGQPAMWAHCRWQASGSSSP